ncbi:MAG: hypothetical protein LQ351_007553 [Letrouitia transgressa]|nr:MAG: hypothetical protein LQ351_007553 [Letrouitia transgressa]
MAYDQETETFDFGIELVEAVLDDEYQPRLQNKGKIERTNVTGFDRKLPMVVYGIREATVHDIDSQKLPCTLIVFRWFIHQRERGKRLRSLRIRVVFATERKDGKASDTFYDPHVRAVAPNGTFSLLQTIQTTEQKATAEGSLEAGFGPASAGLKMGYELTRSVETADRIVINGQAINDYRGQSQGDPDRLNAVEWHLFENESQASGLPTFFRTAVLLERRRHDSERFTATVTLTMEAGLIDDAVRKIKDMVGIIPRDDPIVFDPKFKRTNPSRFNNYSQNLDAYPLEDECKFIMFKTTPEFSKSV